MAQRRTRKAAPRARQNGQTKKLPVKKLAKSAREMEQELEKDLAQLDGQIGTEQVQLNRLLGAREYARQKLCELRGEPIGPQQPEGKGEQEEQKGKEKTT